MRACYYDPIIGRFASEDPAGHGANWYIGICQYHRDADGLYSPPAYLYDEMSSDYDRFLTDGPQNVLDDTDKGQDGTVKHFTKVGNERVCDSITDRYNNATLLTYTTVSIGGVNKALLDNVTDPSGRQILYTWANLGTQAQPAWRITLAQGPAYAVSYGYNADFNLASVTLDPGLTAQHPKLAGCGLFPCSRTVPWEPTVATSTRLKDKLTWTCTWKTRTLRKLLRF